MSDTQTSPRTPTDTGERLVKLETLADETRRTLDKVERSIERLEAWLTGLRSEMTAEFRDVRAAARAQFYWTLAGMAGLLGAIAKGFGWLH